MTFKRISKRIVALVVLATFFVSNHFNIPLYAAENPASQTSVAQTFPKELQAVQVPASIGKIEDSFQGTSQKTIIVVQDAHAVPDAQRNIEKIIEHFQKNYGVSLIGIEGANSELDPQIFKSFPDKDLLRKAFDGYYDEGELTGGTAAAIFSDSPGIFHGIENWKLYEEGVGLYLAAMKNDELLKEKLGKWKENLDARKQKDYSTKLLEVDQKLISFQENKTDLLTVLKFLAEIQPPETSELAVVIQEVTQQNQDNSSAEVEVKQIAAEVKKHLLSQKPSTDVAEDLKKFYAKQQEFNISRLSAQAFALFLNELTEKESLPVHISSELLTGMKNQKMISEIEGTQFFKGFQAYAQTVKDSLIENGEQKKLDQESHLLDLLSRLGRLELSREDWRELKDPENSFEQKQTFVSNWDMSLHLAFYRNAEQRDQALLEKLFSLMEKKKSKTAPQSGLLVAGGFHAHGLTERLKEENISYLMVMPAIASLPGKTHYREQMQGDFSWKSYFEIENGKINMYKAFVRATRDKLLNLATDVQQKLAKEWRDQIVRDLVNQKEAAKAGDYTRFIDERFQKETEPDLQSELQKINHFIEGLRGLQIDNQLSKENVLKLLSPSTVAPTNSIVLAKQDRISSFADLSRVAAENVWPSGQDLINFRKTQMAMSETRNFEEDAKQFKEIGKVLLEAMKMSRDESGGEWSSAQNVAFREAEKSLDLAVQIVEGFDPANEENSREQIKQYLFKNGLVLLKNLESFQKEFPNVLSQELLALYASLGLILNLGFLSNILNRMTYPNVFEITQILEILIPRPEEPEPEIYSVTKEQSKDQGGYYKLLYGRGDIHNARQWYEISLYDNELIASVTWKRIETFGGYSEKTDTLKINFSSLDHPEVTLSLLTNEDYEKVQVLNFTKPNSPHIPQYTGWLTRVSEVLTHLSGLVDDNRIKVSDQQKLRDFLQKSAEVLNTAKAETRDIQDPDLDRIVSLSIKFQEKLEDRGLRKGHPASDLFEDIFYAYTQFDTPPDPDRPMTENQLRNYVINQNDRFQGTKAVLERIGGNIKDPIEQEIYQEQISDLYDSLANLRVNSVHRAETRTNATLTPAKEIVDEGVKLSSYKDLLDLLNDGHFALISAGVNPLQKNNILKIDSQQQTKALSNELKALGFKFMQTKGFYKADVYDEVDPEISFLVWITDADLPKIISLGKQFNQEQVVVSKAQNNEIIYPDSPKRHYGKGYLIDPELENNYTEVEYENGTKTRFTLLFPMVDAVPGIKETDLARRAETRENSEINRLSKWLESRSGFWARLATKFLNRFDRGNQISPVSTSLSRANRLTDTRISEFKPESQPLISRNKRKYAGHDIYANSILELPNGNMLVVDSSHLSGAALYEPSGKIKFLKDEKGRDLADGTVKQATSDVNHIYIVSTEGIIRAYTHDGNLTPEKNIEVDLSEHLVDVNKRRRARWQGERGVFDSAMSQVRKALEQTKLVQAEIKGSDGKLEAELKNIVTQLNALPFQIDSISTSYLVNQEWGEPALKAIPSGIVQTSKNRHLLQAWINGNAVIGLVLTINMETRQITIIDEEGTEKKLSFDQIIGKKAELHSLLLTGNPKNASAQQIISAFRLYQAESGIENRLQGMSDFRISEHLDEIVKPFQEELGQRLYYLTQNRRLPLNRVRTNEIRSLGFDPEMGESLHLVSASLPNRESVAAKAARQVGILDDILHSLEVGLDNAEKQVDLKREDLHVNIQGMTVFEDKMYFTIVETGQLVIRDLKTGEEERFFGPEAVRGDEVFEKGDGVLLETREMALSNVDPENRVLYIVDSGFGGFAGLKNKSARVRGFHIDTHEISDAKTIDGAFSSITAAVDSLGTLYIGNEDGTIHVGNPNTIGKKHWGYFNTPSNARPTTLYTTDDSLLVALPGQVVRYPINEIPNILITRNEKIAGSKIKTVTGFLEDAPATGRAETRNLTDQFNQQFLMLQNMFGSQIDVFDEQGLDLALKHFGFISDPELNYLQRIRQEIKSLPEFRSIVSQGGTTPKVFFMPPLSQTELYSDGQTHSAAFYDSSTKRLFVSLPIAMFDAHSRVLNRQPVFEIHEFAAIALGHSTTPAAEQKLRVIADRDSKRAGIPLRIQTIQIGNGGQIEISPAIKVTQPLADLNKMHELSVQNGTTSLAVAPNNLPADLALMFESLNFEIEDPATGKRKTFSFLDVLKATTDEIIFASHIMSYQPTGEKMVYSVGEMILAPDRYRESILLPDAGRRMIVGTLIPTDAFRTGESIHFRDLFELTHYVARGAGGKVVQQLVLGDQALKLNPIYLNNPDYLQLLSWQFERFFLTKLAEDIQTHPDRYISAQYPNRQVLERLIHYDLRGQFLQEAEENIRALNQKLGLPAEKMDIDPYILYLLDQIMGPRAETRNVKESTTKLPVQIDVALTQLDQLVQAVKTDSFPTTKKPYARTNEIGWDEAIEDLQRQPRPNGIRVHMGAAGLVNYEVAAARESDIVILFDIDLGVLHVHDKIEAIMNSEDVTNLESFKSRFLSDDEMVNLYYAKELRPTRSLDQMEWLNDPKKFHHIQTLFRQGRIFRIPLDFGDQNSLKKISDWLTRNQANLDTVYLTNIHDWMSRFKNNERDEIIGHKNFQTSLLTLTGDPEKSETYIIDSTEGLKAQVYRTDEYPLLKVSADEKFKRAETRNLDQELEKLSQIHLTAEEMSDLFWFVEEYGVNGLSFSSAEKGPMQIEIAYDPNTKMVHFSFQDAGPGLPVEDFKKVSEIIYHMLDPALNPDDPDFAAGSFLQENVKESAASLKVDPEKYVQANRDLLKTFIDHTTIDNLSKLLFDRDPAIPISGRINPDTGDYFARDLVSVRGRGFGVSGYKLRRQGKKEIGRARIAFSNKDQGTRIEIAYPIDSVEAGESLSEFLKGKFESLTGTAQLQGKQIQFIVRAETRAVFSAPYLGFLLLAMEQGKFEFNPFEIKMKTANNERDARNVMNPRWARTGDFRHGHEGDADSDYSDPKVIENLLGKGVLTNWYRGNFIAQGNIRPLLNDQDALVLPIALEFKSRENLVFNGLLQLNDLTENGKLSLIQQLNNILDPKQYLGLSETFRQRIRSALDKWQAVARRAETREEIEKVIIGENYFMIGLSETKMVKGHSVTVKNIGSARDLSNKQIPKSFNAEIQVGSETPIIVQTRGRINIGGEWADVMVDAWANASNVGYHPGISLFFSARAETRQLPENLAAYQESVIQSVAAKGILSRNQLDPNMLFAPSIDGAATEALPEMPNFSVSVAVLSKDPAEPIRESEVAAALKGNNYYEAGYSILGVRAEQDLMTLSGLIGSQRTAAENRIQERLWNTVIVMEIFTRVDEFLKAHEFEIRTSAATRKKPMTPDTLHVWFVPEHLLPVAEQAIEKAKEDLKVKGKPLPEFRIVPVSEASQVLEDVKVKWREPEVIVKTPAFLETILQRVNQTNGVGFALHGFGVPLQADYDASIQKERVERKAPVREEVKPQTSLERWPFAVEVRKLSVEKASRSGDRNQDLRAIVEESFNEILARYPETRWWGNSEKPYLGEGSDWIGESERAVRATLGWNPFANRAETRMDMQEFNHLMEQYGELWGNYEDLSRQGPNVATDNVKTQIDSMREKILEFWTNYDSRGETYQADLFDLEDLILQLNIEIEIWKTHSNQNRPQDEVDLRLSSFLDSTVSRRGIEPVANSLLTHATAEDVLSILQDIPIFKADELNHILEEQRQTTQETLELLRKHGRVRMISSDVVERIQAIDTELGIAHRERLRAWNTRASDYSPNFNTGMFEWDSAVGLADQKIGDLERKRNQLLVQISERASRLSKQIEKYDSWTQTLRDLSHEIESTGRNPKVIVHAMGLVNEIAEALGIKNDLPSDSQVEDRIEILNLVLRPRRQLAMKELAKEIEDYGPRAETRRPEKIAGREVAMSFAEEKEVIREVITELFKTSPIEDFYRVQGKLRAKQILDALDSAKVAEKFYVLMKDPNMVRNYLKFLDFYSSLSRSEDVAELSPRELRQKFIDSMGEVTVYRADLYSEEKFQDVKEHGLRNRFFKRGGTRQEAAEILKTLGLQTVIKANMSEEKVAYYDGRRDRIYFSVSISDEEDPGGKKRAAAIAREIATAYARSRLIDDAGIVGTSPNEKEVREQILKLFSDEKIMIAEAKVPKFFVVQQTGHGKNILADGVQAVPSTPKQVPFQLSSQEEVFVDQLNDPFFEGLMMDIPPEMIQSVTLVPLSEGKAYGHGQIGVNSNVPSPELETLGLARKLTPLDRAKQTAALELTFGYSNRRQQVIPGMELKSQGVEIWQRVVRQSSFKEALEAEEFLNLSGTQVDPYPLAAQTFMSPQYDDEDEDSTTYRDPAIYERYGNWSSFQANARGWLTHRAIQTLSGVTDKDARKIASYIEIKYDMEHAKYAFDESGKNRSELQGSELVVAAIIHVNTNADGYDAAKVRGFDPDGQYAARLEAIQFLFGKDVYDAAVIVEKKLSQEERDAKIEPAKDLAMDLIRLSYANAYEYSGKFNGALFESGMGHIQQIIGDEPFLEALRAIALIELDANSHFYKLVNERITQMTRAETRTDITIRDGNVLHAPGNLIPHDWDLRFLYGAGNDGELLKDLKEKGGYFSLPMIRAIIKKKLLAVSGATEEGQLIFSKSASIDYAIDRGLALFQKDFGLWYLSDLWRLVASFTAQIEKKEADGFFPVYLARDGGAIFTIRDAGEWLTKGREATGVVYHFGGSYVPQSVHEIWANAYAQYVKIEQEHIKNKQPLPPKSEIKKHLMGEAVQFIDARMQNRNENKVFADFIDNTYAELEKLGILNHKKILWIDTGIRGSMPFMLESIVAYKHREADSKEQDSLLVMSHGSMQPRFNPDEILDASERAIGKYLLEEEFGEPDSMYEGDPRMAKPVIEMIGHSIELKEGKGLMFKSMEEQIASEFFRYYILMNAAIKKYRGVKGSEKPSFARAETRNQPPIEMKRNETLEFRDTNRKDKLFSGVIKVKMVGLSENTAWIQIMPRKIHGDDGVGIYNDTGSLVRTIGASELNDDGDFALKRGETVDITGAISLKIDQITYDSSNSISPDNYIRFGVLTSPGVNVSKRAETRTFAEDFPLLDGSISFLYPNVTVMNAEFLKGLYYSQSNLTNPRAAFDMRGVYLFDIQRVRQMRPQDFWKLKEYLEFAKTRGKSGVQKILDKMGSRNEEMIAFKEQLIRFFQTFPEIISVPEEVLLESPEDAHRHLSMLAWSLVQADELELHEKDLLQIAFAHLGSSAPVLAQIIETFMRDPQAGPVLGWNVFLSPAILPNQASNYFDQKSQELFANMARMPRQLGIQNMIGRWRVATDPNQIKLRLLLEQAQRDRGDQPYLSFAIDYLLRVVRPRFKRVLSEIQTNFFTNYGDQLDTMQKRQEFETGFAQIDQREDSIVANWQRQNTFGIHAQTSVPVQVTPPAPSQNTNQQISTVIQPFFEEAIQRTPLPRVRIAGQNLTPARSLRIVVNALTGIKGRYESSNVTAAFQQGRVVLQAGKADEIAGQLNQALNRAETRAEIEKAVMGENYFMIGLSETKMVKGHSVTVKNIGSARDLSNKQIPKSFNAEIQVGSETPIIVQTRGRINIGGEWADVMVDAWANDSDVGHHPGISLFFKARAETRTARRESLIEESDVELTNELLPAAPVRLVLFHDTTPINGKYLWENGFDRKVRSKNIVYDQPSGIYTSAEKNKRTPFDKAGVLERIILELRADLEKPLDTRSAEGGEKYKEILKKAREIAVRDHGISLGLADDRPKFGVIFTQQLVEAGYDAVIVSGQNDAIMAVVLEPEKIKVVGVNEHYKYQPQAPNNDFLRYKYRPVNQPVTQLPLPEWAAEGETAGRAETRKVEEQLKEVEQILKLAANDWLLITQGTREGTMLSEEGFRKTLHYFDTRVKSAFDQLTEIKNSSRNALNENREYKIYFGRLLDQASKLFFKRMSAQIVNTLPRENERAKYRQNENVVKAQLKTLAQIKKFLSNSGTQRRIVPKYLKRLQILISGTEQQLQAYIQEAKASRAETRFLHIAKVFLDRDETATPEDAEMIVDFTTKQGLAAVRSAIIEAVRERKRSRQELGTAETDISSVFEGEIDALIESLKALSDQYPDLKLAIGLVLSGKSEDSLIRNLLKVLGSEEAKQVDNVFVSGRLNQMLQVGLQQSGKHFSLVKSFNPSLTTQKRLPVGVFGEIQNVISQIVMPFHIQDLNKIDDPLIRDYVEVLQVVAMIHAATILANPPDNLDLNNNAAFKAELLRRLNRFTDLEHVIDTSGQGFVIYSVAARAYLEHKADEARKAAA